MATQLHNSSLLDLEPDTIIELYELDLGEEDGLYRFHAGKNDIKDIVFDSFTYYPLPIEATNFEVRGDGQLPRPKLTLANPQGAFTDVVKRRNDLIGNMIIRKRVYLKFLDNENFPNNLNPFGAPDPDSRFDDDIFKINKKTNENKYYLEYELISPLELEDIKIPARIMIANYCPWKYRGIGCLYGQRPLFGQVIQNLEARTFFIDYKRAIETGIVVDTPMGNLGMPIADENNKLFFEEVGYNLTPTWGGDFDKNTTTVTVNNGGGYSTGATSIVVDSLSTVLIKNRTLVFTSGATFKLSKNAPFVTTKSTADQAGSGTAYNIGTNTGFTVEPLEVGIAASTAITFSTGSVFTTGAISYAGASILSGTLAGAALATGVNGSVTTLNGLLTGGVADDEVGTLKYVAGDVVRVKARFFNLAKEDISNTEDDMTDHPDDFFVCIETVDTSKDPRITLTSWRKDQCAKDLSACSCRYKLYGKMDENEGLPFGGYPSIEAYRFAR
tara:strand:+ start:207 stop:1706 length:1500 start_codon:yes stop_codon:yes gene_type:complete